MSGLPRSRRVRFSPRSILAVLALGLSLATGGCSVDLQVNPNPAPASTAGPAVLKDKMDSGLAEVISRRLGQRPDRVTCPSDLPRVVGARVTCEIIKDGHHAGTATVTLDDDSHVHYDLDMELSTQTSAPPGPGR